MRDGKTENEESAKHEGLHTADPNDLWPLPLQVFFAKGEKYT